MPAVILLLAGAADATPQEARVATAPNAKGLVLEDGNTVRLAAIQAPNPGEPMFEKARDFLARLAEGKPVTLEPVADSPDRRGRIVAFVQTQDGRSVQEELLKAGLAMVYTFPDTAVRAETLLALERAARASKRGLWAEPYYAPVADSKAMQHRDRFALVEGTVRAVEERKSATYLNFGEDWKSDFTLTIDRRDRTRHFKDFDLQALEGRRIRVRGWVYSKNGPMLDLTHPQQVEILNQNPD